MLPGLGTQSARASRVAQAQRNLIALTLERGFFAIKKRFATGANHSAICRIDSLLGVDGFPWLKLGFPVNESVFGVFRVGADVCICIRISDPLALCALLVLDDLKWATLIIVANRTCAFCKRLLSGLWIHPRLRHPLRIVVELRASRSADLSRLGIMRPTGLFKLRFLHLGLFPCLPLVRALHPIVHPSHVFFKPLRIAAQPRLFRRSRRNVHHAPLRRRLRHGCKIIAPSIA